MNKICAVVLPFVMGGVAFASEPLPDAYELIMNGVREDAATHTSLQGDGPTITPTGLIQTGWSYSGGGDDADVYGFDVYRARLGIVGNIGDDASFRLNGEWTPGSGFDLLEAFVDYRGFDFADVRVGQFVPTFYSGFVANPADLTTQTYSITAQTFGQGYGQGIELSRSFGDVELNAFYNNGFDNLTGVSNGDYAVGFHVGYEACDWFSLGGGYAYIEGANQYMTYTLDTTFTVDEFSLNAAWVSNDMIDGWENYSLVGTASFNVTDQAQLFGQYEYGNLGGFAGGNLSVGTIGLNYDLTTGVKWTNSVGYAFEDIAAGFDTADTGWNASAGQGEYVVRSFITISF
jgi:hypothetical protein